MITATKLPAETHEARTAAETATHGVELNGTGVGQYTDLRDNLAHRHSLDDLVGYVVRETIGTDGVALWRDLDGERIDGHDREGRCGYDIALVTEPTQYAQAIALVAAYRAAGRYAVSDQLFRCGCRSGL